MNSPWDPISSESSRRSSLVNGPANQDANLPSNTTGMSHHLDRLRKKAQTIQQQTGNPVATPTPQLHPRDIQGNNPVHNNGNSGRMSAMSGCSLPGSANQMNNMHLQQQYNMMQTSSQMNNQHGVRRASDPVRALDRNFGLSNNEGNLQQSSRNRFSGSYTQLSNMQQLQMQQQGRVPLHGQRIRGTSGDFAQNNQTTLGNNQVRSE